MVDSVNNGVGSLPVQSDRSQQRDRTQVQAEVSPQPSQPSAEVDVQVELSTEASNIQKVREAAEQAPEVRDERVDKIREKIANGELKVNNQNIALQLILE